MKGRLEHELRTTQNIERLLLELPECVSDFYYNMQISREPMSCLEYIRKIKSFLDFANCDVDKIDGRIIGHYFKEIKLKRDKDGKVVGSTSFTHQKTVWTVLNRFFCYLVSTGIILNNPMSNTERPSNKDDVKRKFLSIDDLNAILQTVQNGAGTNRAIAKQKDWIERDILIMFLFMNTGMRKTALSEINIEDISFKDRELTVTDKRNKTQIYDINDEMEEVLNTWLRKREVLLKGEKNDALFISSLRKRISEKAIYNLVKKYSEEALGYYISPHKLRGAFISLYYEATGCDIKAACEAAGHADISTTSIYITKKNNSRKEAQNFMSKNLILN